MAKPILFAIDDDPEVLRAVERDLRRQYGEHYRVMRASSGPSAVEALEHLKAATAPWPLADWQASFRAPFEGVRVIGHRSASRLRRRSRSTTW